MQCNAIQCNATQCNAMQCNAMQCNAMQCNAMQCNAMQYNAMQCNVNKNRLKCNAMRCAKLIKRRIHTCSICLGHSIKILSFILLANNTSQTRFLLNDPWLSTPLPLLLPCVVLLKRRFDDIPHQDKTYMAWRLITCLLISPIIAQISATCVIHSAAPILMSKRETSPDVGLMLVRRRRRRTNISPALCEYIVFIGYWCQNSALSPYINTVCMAAINS